MKILVVQDGDWIKKGPHQQHHLMEKLSIRGHEIRVIGYDQLWKNDTYSLISKRKEFDVCKIYKGANIKFIRPAFIKLSILDYISFLISSRVEIKKSIEEFDPDIVIGFTSVLSNYWGMKFAKNVDIPFIYYWTDVIHELIPFKPFRYVAKIIEKHIIEKSDKIIAINEVLKDYLIDFGADPNITEVISGGVDLQRFDRELYINQQIREKFNIQKDALVLFFMGWIYEFSGLYEITLELIRNKNKNSNIRMVVVGEGDYYAKLKEMVNINNMQDSIILTGKVPYDYIPYLISMADICILPAHNNQIMKDIVPIKIYEYLAMHKPVISTRLPGVMKEFGENNGIIYVEKPDDVIKKVMKLDIEEIKRNSVMAKDFIKNYDWNNIIDMFEKLLFELKNKTKK